jgi:hypothetical protein
MARNIGGTAFWGAPEDKPVAPSFAKMPKTVTYNAGYLKSLTPRIVMPIPGPGAFRSTEIPHAVTDAAHTEFPPEIPVSHYNKGYLKSLEPKRFYPFGRGPLTQSEVFAKLSKAEAPEVIPEPDKIYDPADILKTLKLLKKGNLTEEQLEGYEEAAGRLRAYAALKKQRPLKVEEQVLVDEIGGRLDKEAKELVAEDVGFVRDKQQEVATLDTERLRIAGEKAAALKDAEDFERVRDDLNQTVKKLRAKEKRVGAQLEVFAASPEYVNLLAEEGRGWPAADTPKKLEKLQHRLDRLRSVGAKANARLYELRDEKAEAKRKRDNAQQARDAALATAAALDPQLQAVVVQLESTQADRRVNPRFTLRATKAEQELPMLIDAIEISQMPDAKEDKTADEEFAHASVPGGPVYQFYTFNAVSHGLADPKFISNDDLRDAWSAFVATNPSCPKKAPWATVKNRKAGLKLMLESSKVPSAFKMQILRRTGFA